jgi:flagellar biosynthesis GTPase FlhF
MASGGGFDFEQTKMTKPERAERLWLVVALVMQKAILLGGELEAQEQEAHHKKQRKPGKPRRRGRPAAPSTRPRGREQSVLLRGIMAIRAAESGGKKVLAKGMFRAEPLPWRLYAVSRVPKSYQLKKQRREEKKRNRQRAQTRERREQRAVERAAKEAEVQARKLARQERQMAKEAEVQARKLARQERRMAKEAEVQARKLSRQERRMAKEAQAQACQQVKPAFLQVNSASSRPLREPRSEEILLPHLQNEPFREARKLASPRSESLGVSLSATQHLETQPSPGRGPLLRLSRGRLQPPHKLVRKEIRQTRDHGSAQQAGP